MEGGGEAVAELEELGISKLGRLADTVSIRSDSPEAVSAFVLDGVTIRHMPSERAKEKSRAC